MENPTAYSNPAAISDGIEIESEGETTGKFKFFTPQKTKLDI